MDKQEESIYQKIKRLCGHIAGLKVPVYASHACYFIVLSAFPMLVLLLGMLRYTGLEIQNLTDIIEGFIPSALMPAAKRLILSTYKNTSGAVLSISAVAALWSASRGIYGLLIGFNSIYRVKENVIIKINMTMF